MQCVLIMSKKTIYAIQYTDGIISFLILILLELKMKDIQASCGKGGCELGNQYIVMFVYGVIILVKAQ